MSDGAAPDIVAACRRLHHAIDRLDQAAADSIGVSRNDLRCLNLLEHGGISPSLIGAQLGLTSGSVTALIGRLERRGFVARSRGSADRRGVLVSATPLVFRTLGGVYRRFAEEIRAAAGRYGTAEQADAIRHLDDACRACEAAIGQRQP